MKNWNAEHIARLQAKGMVVKSTTPVKDLENEAHFSPAIQFFSEQGYDKPPATPIIAQRIPVKPMTINRAYTGRKYKTDRYREYKSLIKSYLQDAHVPFGSYELLLLWGMSDNRSDCDNPCKPFLDLLQAKYGFNDKYIQRLVIEKVLVEKGSEFIEFQLNLL